MGDWIVLGIIVFLVVCAIWYLVKEKRKGNSCIGCSSAGCCSGCQAGKPKGKNGRPEGKKEEPDRLMEKVKNNHGGNYADKKTSGERKI